MKTTTRFLVAVHADSTAEKVTDFVTVPAATKADAVAVGLARVMNCEPEKWATLLAAGGCYAYTASAAKDNLHPNGAPKCVMGHRVTFGGRN